jgi:hypothetical protein
VTSDVLWTRLALGALPLVSLWGAFALWFQVPGGTLRKRLVIALWLGFGAACMLTLWRGSLLPGVAAFVLAFGSLLLWWRRLAPSNERLWADDVARMTTGSIAGEEVTLHNVRNFDWRSESDYTQRWETRSYDLARLVSLDMVLSYWSLRTIAHVLISFGFEDRAQVVFSVEIRRQKAQRFSEIGGFFKEFELSIIAADERDIIGVRTNVRGEDDYLYHIRIPVPAMRALFLEYVRRANQLVQRPRYYDTIRVNCTTLVFHMMKGILGKLPLDYRLLLSGLLPGYVYRVGGLDSRYTLAELRRFGRITERARRAEHGADFCAAIRAGIPPLELPR